ncbi:MAG: SRPBCC family protein [Bdellovibrionales bacterium]|nr:SRPBCC family protein [Bdellovibrionales bacterium]
MAKVTREKIMEVSPEALYKAITEFNAYPEFIPEVVEATIKAGANDDKTIVTFELELIKRFQYTLQFRMRKNREVVWKLVESNFFKTNEGRWLLEPADRGGVQVQYELEVGFGFLVPKFISKKLTEVNLPKMFDNFERRAQGL